MGNGSSLFIRLSLFSFAMMKLGFYDIAFSFTGN